MANHDLDADARALRDEAELLNRQTREKIDAYRKQAKRLTWVVLAVGLLMVTVGIAGANISANNNQILHESEYAFCAAGLPPPSIAKTPACVRAQRATAARNAAAGTPFAVLVCHRTVGALGGHISLCTHAPRRATRPTPIRTVFVPGPTLTVTVTKCIRPSGKPC